MKQQFSPRTSRRLCLTNHAFSRMIERDFSLNDIDFLFQNGRQKKQKDVIKVRLNRQDKPQKKSALKQFLGLIESTMVLDLDGRTVITVYDNYDAPSARLIH